MKLMTPLAKCKIPIPEKSRNPRFWSQPWPKIQANKKGKIKEEFKKVKKRCVSKEILSERVHVD